MSAIISPFPSFSLPIGGDDTAGRLAYANESTSEFYAFSNINADASAKLHGTNGFKAVWSGSIKDNSGKLLLDPAREGDTAARMYIYIGSGYTWVISSEFGTIIEIATAALATRAALNITTDGAGVPSGWRVYSAAGSSDYTTGFALDTWICIELVWKYAAPDSVDFYVNNSLVGNVAGNSDVGRNCQWIYFGCRGAYNPQSGAYIYFDDCVVDDAYIGLYPS